MISVDNYSYSNKWITQLIEKTTLVVSRGGAMLQLQKNFMKFTLKCFAKKATRYGSALDMKTFYTQWNI